MHRRARALAASGRFSGWAGIVFELEYFEGFPLAPAWLNYTLMIEELDKACKQAKIRHPPRNSQNTFRSSDE